MEGVKRKKVKEKERRVEGQKVKDLRREGTEA